MFEFNSRQKLSNDCGGGGGGGGGGGAGREGRRPFFQVVKINAFHSVQSLLLFVCCCYCFYFY